MTINNNILLYKEIPGTQRYVPIDGSLVRSGEYIYLEVGDNEVVTRITRNGIDIGSLIIVDGRYQLYVENCSDEYVVYYQPISPLIIAVSIDTEGLENPVFQINN